MQGKKPRTLRLGLDFSRIDSFQGFTVHADGRIEISGTTGAVDFQSGSIGLSYPRDNDKGPKVTVELFDAPGQHATIAASVHKFRRVFGVDTNWRKIGGQRLAVSTVAEIRDYQLTAANWSATFQPLWAREFHGIGNDPERVGWHEALLLLSARGYLNDGPSLLVVDSHLGELADIARRRAPIFANYLLPESVYLAYASADKQTESPLNRLIWVCDAVSSERLLLTAQNLANMAPANADPQAPYRAWFHWQIEAQ